MLRSRCFCLELYPDSDSYNCNDKLEFIKNNYDYAFILHNKDIYDCDVVENNSILHKRGDLKKPHYHVIISFKNARSINNLKDEIGDVLHIETCNFYSYTRYLIHLGYPNKFQYSQYDIITNMQLRIYNALKRDYNSQEQDSRILLDFIFSHSVESYLTFKQLTEYAIANDCLLELKRNTYFYKQFCDEWGYRRC